VALAGDFQLTWNIPVYVCSRRQEVGQCCNIFRAQPYTAIYTISYIRLSQLEKRRNDRIVIILAMVINPGCEITLLLISDLFTTSVSY